MDAVKQEVPTGFVEGAYDTRFQPVVDAFLTNFDARDELGASVCLTVGGETVVNLWGGTADEATGAPWTTDTVSVVQSNTKGATALCAHVLAARGLLDLGAPVAEYWPEFAREGKEHTTVRMMLDHSAGIPVFRGPVEPLAFYDWDHVVARLEAELPFWEPGTRHGYHLLNFGWTVGELVRRVSGKSLGAFFAEAVAGPLGLDFWIGLPEEIEPRVAPLLSYAGLPSGPPSDFVVTMLADRESIPACAVRNLLPFDHNSRAHHAAEIGGGGGITNARGLAGMYRPLANGGGDLVDADGIARMRRVSSATNKDATLRIPTRFGMGFMVSMDNRRVPAADSVILGEHAFGHVGMGGSVGFADVEHGLSFGYTMNRMGPGILMNERGQSLIDAAYRVLGCVSDITGNWR